MRQIETSNFDVVASTKAFPIVLLIILALVMSIVVAQAALGQEAKAARGATPGDVLAACREKGAKITAELLPAVIEPGHCSFVNKQIEDHGISVAVPAAGHGIYAEAYGPRGSQELLVSRRADGTVTLAEVGRENPEASSRILSADQLRASALGACSDPHYYDWPYALRDHLRYSFNSTSTPSELGRLAALQAIRAADNNLARSTNDCGMADVVPAHMIYEGPEGHGVNIGTGANCAGSDNRSVIGFGTLPRNYTAFTCTTFAIQPGYDRPTESDTRINKRNYTWTTRPTMGSCNHRYDLESTVTHERGHTFGLGHVSESNHGNLTMSSASNGACQFSERTLGRGDVLGLANKYR